MRALAVILLPAALVVAGLARAEAPSGGAGDRVTTSGLTRTEESPRHPRMSFAVVSGIYGALYMYTYLAWYRRGESSGTLHFRREGWFGKDTYAGGADKVGHAWTNYALTRGVIGISEWGGYSKRASLVASTGLAVGFSLLIELKDGYEPEYGFSWADALLNLGGNAFGVAMELSPALDEMFDFRIEYWPSKYFRQEMRTEGLFNGAEDYTGQRFLISYHLSSVSPLRQSPAFGWTEWLDVTLGYQARHYKPGALDPSDPVQDLFVGISLNLQHLLDRTLIFKSSRGKRVGTGLRTLRFGTEIVAVPFTTLKVGGVSRTGPKGRPAER